MAVARILFKNVIRRIFVECARLNTVEWIAPEVPIFQICRELASSRMKVLGIRLGCEDLSEVHGLQRSTSTLARASTTSRSYPLLPGISEVRQDGDFSVPSTSTSFQSFKNLFYCAGHWDADVENFLARCSSLEVLVISCTAISLHLQLPSLVHLQVFGMRASSNFQLFPATLP